MWCRCADNKRQAAERRARRYADANLPHQRPGQTARTFENFKPTKGAVQAVKSANAFSDGEISMLTLVGVQGTGKTHLLEAIGRRCLEAGETVRYDLVSELLDRLRGTYAAASEEDLWSVTEWYRTRGVLLLDDIGLEAATDWAAEKVTALVDERYRNGGRLVVATNSKDRDTMADHMGARLADRLWDVNSGIVHQAYITSPSYRTAK